MALKTERVDDCEKDNFYERELKCDGGIDCRTDMGYEAASTDPYFSL